MATQPAYLAPLFGVNVDPRARDPRAPFERARLADAHGLDLIGVQDHPYNSGFFETWTLLTALGTATRRVHLITNVMNTPLRLPAMIAKPAATLDVLTGGRVELGLGAGAFAQGIVAYGGVAREPAEALAAFEDTIRIVRGMLDSAGSSFSYAGRFHQVRGARPGAPHRDMDGIESSALAAADWPAGRRRAALQHLRVARAADREQLHVGLL